MRSSFSLGLLDVLHPRRLLSQAPAPEWPDSCAGIASHGQPRNLTIRPFRANVRSFRNLMTIDNDFAELKQRLQTIEDLRDAERVLVWDQATHMPARAAGAR